MNVFPSPSSWRTDKSWNVKHWTNDTRSKLSSETDELQLTCVPHKVGMTGGTGFFAVPDGFPTVSDVETSYEVFFPTGFDWVRGGKVGLGIGLGDRPEIASGGDWMNSCGSLRVMWREDGEVIGYVYLPLENRSKTEIMHRQGSDASKATENTVTLRTGLNVWYTKDAKQGALRFRAGAWNTVTLRASLNTPGHADGSLTLIVNGQQRTVRGFRFRDNLAIKFNGIILDFFFGGGDSSWASKSSQTVKIRHPRVSPPALPQK